jgi:hypothetical protein
MWNSSERAQAEGYLMDNNGDIEQFEKLEQQLHSFLREISELSHKKPNDGLNHFKLKFINSTLESLNEILGARRPFKDFEKFDADELPTNSDVPPFSVRAMPTSL